MKVTMKVTTIDGHTYLTGPSEDGTEEQMKQLEELVREFKKLDYLTLEPSEGTTVILNPAHIISITITKSD